MAALWLTNPLTNQMLGPFTILLLTMFGAAALALLIVQGLRGVLLSGDTLANTTSTPQKVLWQRYRTWAIIAFLSPQGKTKPFYSMSIMKEDPSGISFPGVRSLARRSGKAI